MKSAATAVISGVVGIAIGAAGWALLGPEKSTSAPTAAHSSIAPSASTGGVHYASAQAVADRLDKAGLVISMLHKNTDANWLSEIGGTAYDLVISEKAGQQIGDSGINMFSNHKATAAWVSLSESMGGVAVVGDNWAVSLPSGASDRAVTNRIAPRVAETLGGTVKR